MKWSYNLPFSGVVQGGDDMGNSGPGFYALGDLGVLTGKTLAGLGPL